MTYIKSNIYFSTQSVSFIQFDLLSSECFQDRAAPPTPPSRSAALLMNQPPMSLKEVFRSALKVKNITTVGIQLTALRLPKSSS